MVVSSHKLCCCNDVWDLYLDKSMVHLVEHAKVEKQDA